MRYSLLFLFFCAVSFNLFAEEIRCPVSRDTWISSAHRDEVDGNGGKASHIKLKFYQEYGLLDFDVSALKGKKIEKAVLFIAAESGVKFGGERGTDLRWFSISTISSEWVEGEGISYTKDEKGKGASFNEASYKTRPWTIPGSKNWDVILGNGKTLRCDVDGGDPKNGWFAIPLDPRLVQARAAGASYGFAILDGSTGVYCNSFIHSKESKKPPYLMVTVAGADAAAPAAPADLKIEPAPNDASMSNGAVRVSLKVPADAFAYAVKVNGEDVPRWQIPFAAAPGATQSFLIEHLPPDGDVKLEVAALDSTGNASPVATASGKASPKITVPCIFEMPWKPKGGAAPANAGKVTAWAYPEISKLDPLSGKIILEKGAENASAQNTVWDAGESTVRIAAARGEIASFQLALESAEPGTIKIKVAGLDGIQTKLWRTWFVKIKETWQAEYAIPMSDSVELPAPDNKITGQKAASVTIDLIVPEATKAGDYTGTLSVSGGPSLKVLLKVYDVVIPKEIHFNPELNAYSGPGQAGSEMFFDSFRLAHYHRATINRVPYSHVGTTHADWIPKIDGKGRVTDWAEFDKNLGPLLDGSAFKDNPRAGVPVKCLYLPHSENWPLMMLPNYKPGEKVPLIGNDWKQIHDIYAKPPEEAFNQDYKDAFVNNVSDFVKHFEAKGWTRTAMHGYNNNKINYNMEKLKGTAWTLDEPTEYLDWHALKFFSSLFHQGIAAAKPEKAVFHYRGDISRPHWQGNCFDGLMEIMYSNSELFDWMPLMRDHKRRMPTILVCYGEANANDSANHETTAWCIKSYVHECDGIVPWQCLGKDQAFDKGDNKEDGNSLIVEGKRFGVNAIASYRVHAMRSGAQIAELLRLLEIKRGWSRLHSAAVVSQKLPLGTKFSQSFADDAAAVKFSGLSGDRFVQLKEGLLRMLTE